MMETQRDFFKRLTTFLERAGIPYMVAGSVGSSFYGQPRATNDIDIVIDPNAGQLEQFLTMLCKDYYVSVSAAKDALRNRSMFNVIDNQTGWKADLIIRQTRPFSQQEFERRQSAQLLGLDTWLLSPEDSILSKLEWSKGRQDTAQLKDSLSVLVSQWDKLDFDYLRKWASVLETGEMLEDLIKQTEQIRAAGTE
jgi:hypothetical protein